jgi:hypothetical protein
VVVEAVAVAVAVTGGHQARALRGWGGVPLGGLTRGGEGLGGFLRGGGLTDLKASCLNLSIFISWLIRLLWEGVESGTPVTSYVWNYNQNPRT